MVDHFTSTLNSRDKELNNLYFGWKLVRVFCISIYMQMHCAGLQAVLLFQIMNKLASKQDKTKRKREICNGYLE